MLLTLNSLKFMTSVKMFASRRIFRSSNNYLKNGIKGENLCRCLSTAEISTALRPFYFRVHPDLFGKYPIQRAINEKSLQQLSALIEAQQRNLSLNLPSLTFYLKQKKMPEGPFQLVTIHLNGKNIRDNIFKILNSCDISTKYLDEIKKTPDPEDSKSARLYQDFGIYGFQDTTSKRSYSEEKEITRDLLSWINLNSADAKEKYNNTAATRNQVDTLTNQIQNLFGIKQVKWDRGWNVSLIRGALQSLFFLATQHSQYMGNLKNRTLAFGQFTGVSLDGDIFLNITDVRNDWLRLIKKVQTEDTALDNIPKYERTLSSLLRDISVRRRKFMPKVSATQYCNHLRQLITSIGDFYGSGKNTYMSLPDSLKKYQIVVEPEAGPLMVSPTGQFITPSSCPVEELFSFIEKNLDEAMLLLTEYSINKHVEKSLHQEVKERFELLDLQKDDSVTPALMISCCERLLAKKHEIDTSLRGNILYVTNYYSVLSEGILCIPWNFEE